MFVEQLDRLSSLEDMEMVTSLNISVACGER